MVPEVCFRHVLCRVAAVFNDLHWLGDMAQYPALACLAWDTIGTATLSSYSSRSFRNRSSWVYFLVLIVETTVPFDQVSMGNLGLICW